MTKEQYNEFNNDDHLTSEDKKHQSKLNTKNRYGLSDNQLLTLTRQHRAAREIKDYETMTKIEYRLTQINFHYESGKLKRGEYNEIINNIL